jgi:Predicted ATPase (AAA+ superfamily)
MRPMSLFESGDSSGDVSLFDLMKGSITTKMTGDVSLINLANFIIRGGWPSAIGLPMESAALLPSEYIKLVIDDDFGRLDGKNFRKDKLKLLLRSLARNESTTVSNSTLKKDIKDIDDEDIDLNTIATYLEAFDRLFLTDQQLPFNVGMRSSMRVKQSVKRHFSDPSLAAALLNATSQSLIDDLKTFGFLFEALCERDLKIYAESFGASLFHYQDYCENEIDAVIEMPDGSWGAFEIKLGANQIDKAASNLTKIKNKMSKDPKGKPPVVLCVITGMSSAAYQRSDGVFVVPITTLKN